MPILSSVISVLLKVRKQHHTSR